MRTWTTRADIKVPAKPNGLWTLVVDFVKKDSLLRFEAGTERWYYGEAESQRCTADGDPASLLSRAGCLVPAAPVGAIVGKIGGSSAGLSDGALFVVGGFCTLQLGPDVEGPLFITINDEASGMSNNRDFITLVVSLAT